MKKSSHENAAGETVMKDLFTLREGHCRHLLKLSGTVSLSLSLLLGLSAWTPARALERIRMGLSVRNVVFLPYYCAQENNALS